MRLATNLWIIGALGLAITACSSKKPADTTPLDANPPATSAPQDMEAQPPTTADSSAPAAPTLPPVELGEGTASDAPAKMPTLAIKAPAKDAVLPTDKAGDTEVKLDLKNWDAGTGGAHVHLILDGRPYKRIDDATKPIKLKDLDPSYTIADGQHVLVAFPSRHTHESVKPNGKASPLAVTTFWVGKKGEAKDIKWKTTDPTLVYSRPKGDNPGPPPPEGILVDFYLANAELGDGKFSIEATLVGPGADNGVKATIKSWKPWRIKNVRDGKYNLHLVLMDKDGKPVPGSWNDSTHEFNVDTKAAPPPPPPDAKPAADAKPADKKPADAKPADAKKP